MDGGERSVAAGGGRREAPPPLVAWAHLAVLWSFAVAKPLFDILADSPEFFVARENTAGDIVLLALAVTLAPPTLMLVLELPLARAPKARLLLHLVFVALLGAALAVQVLKDVTNNSSALLIPLSLAVGAAGAVAYARGRVVRAALGMLAPVPLIFLAVFLLGSPVSDLVFPDESRSVESAVAGDARVPVVIVIFDELSGRSLMDSGGRIDATRYPNFARLAGDATWYPNATTVADSTGAAVPAILTGERPEEHDVPTTADHPNSLFSFLGRRYIFNVEEPVTNLCPEALCGKEERDPATQRWRDLASDLSIVLLHRLLPDTVRDGLPAVDQAFSDFRGTADRPNASGSGSTSTGAPVWSRRRGAVERFVKAIHRGRGTPTLDFAHFELPHVPWEYLPSGQRYVSGDAVVRGTTDEVWTTDRRLVVEGHQRYLLQLGYVDRVLGRLLDRLRSEGLYDRALLVVTADHGVSFRPGKHRRSVSKSSFADIAGIPLFIKPPRQRRGRTDRSPARTIDILPTVAEQLGARLSWDSDGRPLSAPATRGARSLSVHGVFGSVSGIPVSAFRRQRDRTVALDTELLGSGDGGRGVFAPGAEASLVGKLTRDFPSAPSLPARAELDTPGATAPVGSDAAVVPALTGGRIVGDFSPGQLLAVAVNGRIAALTRTFAADGGSRFESMVDPTAFRPGSNRITLFAVSGGSEPRLAALGQRPSERYKLVTRAGHLWIIGSHGDRRRVAGRGGGFIESVENSRGDLSVRGWSANERTGASQRVLFFIAGRFVGATKPSETRRDVADVLGPRALVSGFAFGVHLTGPQDSRQSVRAFGVGAGRAAELKTSGR